MKRMHRLIGTSATYKQSSKVVRTDVAPELFSRQSRLRLHAEYVRDAALSVSGL